MGLSILAVIAGFFATILLVGIGTAIANKLCDVPMQSGSVTIAPHNYLIINFVFSFLAAVGGGFVCGWIAQDHKILQPIILAGILLILSIATQLTTGPQPGQPRWYNGAIGVIGASGVLVGGAIWFLI